MEAKHKELLLKDLCARLPYGVKGNFQNSDDKLLRSVTIMYRYLEPGGMVMTGDIKPYLFPLSSMTDEQKKEYNRRKHDIQLVNAWGYTVEEVELLDSPESFEYLIENHFDYHGLIPMGLAIDATGLNIY